MQLKLPKELHTWISENKGELSHQSYIIKMLYNTKQSTTEVQGDNINDNNKGKTRA